MKYITYPQNETYSTIEQVLINRGMKKESIRHWLNTSDEDINSQKTFGLENIRNAAKLIFNAISLDWNTLIVVDADCDGYTSAALLINYLEKIAPAYVADGHIEFVLHDEKRHGLKDLMNKILNSNYRLVICPDSSSNDQEEHRILKEHNINVLVLDHHPTQDNKISENAIIINNQLSNYPNKELSGVGITWQFCRYLDSILSKKFANDFLDLVALGNMADMMSLQSIETKHLIHKGFKEENIKNPFIYAMINKNEFSLNKSDYCSFNGLRCTPMGAAFFIAPLINALVRSGTPEEQMCVFKSLLNIYAYKKIPSTKRGHKPGDEETIVEQALRICTNVKNHQTKAQDEGMELLESMIENENLLSHKILLFLLKPGQINRNIAGLVANKLAAKYQKPCCVLTLCEDEKTGELSYQGSARGYEKCGLLNFKQVCLDCPYILSAEGHGNAFGLGIKKENIQNFLNYIDITLKDLPDEPVYRLDQFFIENQANASKHIIDIAYMNDFWGKDIDRAYVGIRFRVTPNNFTIMKGNTLKFTLPNNVSVIKWSGTEEEINEFTVQSGYIDIEVIGKCNVNTWNGNSFAQIIVEDYQIINKAKYEF